MMSDKLNENRLCLIESNLIDFNKFNYYLAESSIKKFSDEPFKIDKVITRNFWNDNNHIRKHKELANTIYDSLISSLSSALNKLHEEQHKDIYWERIIGSWVWFYVTNYLEKYDRLEFAFKKKPNLLALCINPLRITPSQSTMSYLNDLRNGDTYHLQQYGFIMRDFYENNLQEINTEVFKPKKILLKKTHSLKHNLALLIQKIIGKGFTRGKYILFCTRFSNLDLIKISIKSKFRAVPIFKNYEENYQSIYDTKLRDKLKFTQLDNDIDNFDLIFSIMLSIKHVLPLDFIEEYESIKHKSNARISKNLPSKIITGVGFSLDTEFAVWAASCGEKGSLIYGCQHGGRYGDTKVIADEYIERKISDYYIGWGWNDGGEIIKLPSQLLSSRSLLNRDPIKLLWVMTLDSRHSYHIEEMVFGDRFYKYFDNQKIFFDALSLSTKKNLVIRKYPQDFGWNINQRLGYCSEYFNDSNSSFKDNLSSSKLVVIDHIGSTTALECAALSIPFIIISDERDYNFRESSELISKKLIKANILFTDYLEAAKYINSNFNNIEEWWNESYRKATIKEYKDSFASIDKNYIQIWNNFFNKK
jgi:putative transferase (TIGR04331 family)